MSVKQLIREDLQNLIEYQNETNNTHAIRLHANESPWDPLSDYQWHLNFYPEKNNKVLTHLLSQRYGVDEDQLILTRGSDDGIDIITRLFITPFKDAVIICPPTFVMYEMSAQIQGGTVIKCPLSDNNFELDDNAIEQAINQKNSKILFICRPNNPTGNTISIDKIATLCYLAKDKVMVVVDEAYLEFCSQASAAKLLSQFDNLIVLRTLSKAYGLAGLRVGVVLASCDIIQYLNTINSPFPISTPVMALACESLIRESEISNQIDYICQQRSWLATELSKLSIIVKIWPSDANFLLIRVNDSSKVFNHLKNNNILVRKISDDLIRISIGTDIQNMKMIDVLRGYR